MNKEQMLSLLNYEGDVLKAKKINDPLYPHKAEFVIYDQWNSIVDILNLDDLLKFLDGEMILHDSEGNKWDFSKAHKDAKPTYCKLYNFLK